MKSLQVIMPVYNEKTALPIVIEEWAHVLSALSINYEFIICEDGSTDGTKEILTELKHKYPLVVNQANQRRGYGNAMLSGIKQSRAKQLLCIDSDGQCDPNDFAKFWASRNNHTILLGERKPRRDTKLRRVYSFFFHLFFKLFYFDNLKDPSSCFMLAPSRVIKKLSSDILYSAESFRWGVCAAAIKKKVAIKEIRINHRNRLSGRTRVFTLKNTPGIVLRGAIGILRIKFSSN